MSGLGVTMKRLVAIVLILSVIAVVVIPTRLMLAATKA